MSDLSLDPKAGLLAMINQVTTVPVALTDLQEIYPPEVIADAEPGEPNTRITVKTTLDFSHAGRVTFEYSRLNLADFTPYDLTATVDDIDTFEDYLQALSARYGIHFRGDDLEPTTAFDVSTGPLTYTYTLAAKPESLVFTGQGTFHVNVTWRFDDPEWIELNVDRLSTLLQNDLPLSLLSFLNP